MDQYQKQQWQTWLSSIPKDQQEVLFDILKSAHPSTSNGHAKAIPVVAEKELRIEREPVEDLLYESPPYVDILGLHPVYDRIAFQSNLLLKGPKGDGKSLSVISWAAKHTIPLVIVECSEDTKKYDLHGSQSLVGDETVYVLGAIPTAIDVANEAGRCILLFEELNALTPQVQKQINAVTDFRKMASLRHIGRTYKLEPGKHLWVVGTMNPSVYGGTYDLNEDLKSRFEEIEVTYPATAHEKHVLKTVCADVIGHGQGKVDEATLDLIIKFAKETRQQATGYALSTRDVVRFVYTVAQLGLDIALQMVVCKFEGEDRDTVMKRMSSVFGPRNTKKFWGA